MKVRIPAVEVIPVIEEHCAKLKYDNPLAVLAHRAGIEFDTLYKIVEMKRTKTVEIGFVDQIFAAMGDPIGLWQRPTLQPYYDMLLPHCSRRGCDNILPFDPELATSQRNRRYCSIACRQAVYRHRAGGTNQRVECRNGHERTEENTRTDAEGHAVCIQCERDKGRRQRRKKGQRSLARTCRNGHPRRYTVTTYPPSRPNGHRRCLVCEGKVQLDA